MAMSSEKKVISFRWLIFLVLPLPTFLSVFTVFISP